MTTGQDFGPSSTFEKSRPNIVPGPGRIAIPPRLTQSLTFPFLRTELREPPPQPLRSG